MEVIDVVKMAVVLTDVKPSSAVDGTKDKDTQLVNKLCIFLVGTMNL